MTTMKMTMMTSHNQYLHHHPITITIIIAIIITVNDGRYVACALPWDGRVSVIQTFCCSKRRYAQNEHLRCIAIGALYGYTQTHKINIYNGRTVQVHRNIFYILHFRM